MKTSKGLIRIKVLHVIDGDSFQAEISELGPTSSVLCNLYGVDAPEIVSTERAKALEVHQFLISATMSLGSTSLYIRPIKIHKDGRCSVVLYRGDDKGLISINSLLIKSFNLGS